MHENTDLEKLSKCIVFGEELLEKFTSEKNLAAEHLVVISVYRKLLEQLDGNFVLADHKLQSASTVMIRATFETYLGLKYILQEKRRVKDRAFCYYIGYYKSQLAAAEYSKGHFSAELPKERLENTVNAIEKTMNDPKYKKIVKAWEKAKSQQKIPYEPKWYSLFNGPRSVKQLVSVLDEPEIYKFYELLSIEAHGYQALNGLEAKDASLFLKPLRDTNDDYYESLARSFFTDATLKIINALFPQHEGMFIKFLRDIGFIPSTLYNVRL